MLHFTINKTTPIMHRFDNVRAFVCWPKVDTNRSHHNEQQFTQAVYIWRARVSLPFVHHTITNTSSHRQTIHTVHTQQTIPMKRYKWGVLVERKNSLLHCHTCRLLFFCQSSHLASSILSKGHLINIRNRIGILSFVCWMVNLNIIMSKRERE